jgi:hypothetical protein
VTPEAPLAGYGGRRFVLTVAASLLYTLLLIADLLSQDAYVTLQMMTVGAYMAANSVQKWAHEKRDAPDSK